MPTTSMPDSMPEPELKPEQLVSPEFQIFTPPHFIGFLNGMSSLIKPPGSTRPHTPHFPSAELLSDPSSTHAGAGSATGATAAKASASGPMPTMRCPGRRFVPWDDSSPI